MSMIKVKTDRKTRWGKSVQFPWGFTKFDATGNSEVHETALEDHDMAVYGLEIPEEFKEVTQVAVKKEVKNDLKKSSSATGDQKPKSVVEKAPESAETKKAAKAVADKKEADSIKAAGGGTGEDVAAELLTDLLKKNTKDLRQLAEDLKVPFEDIKTKNRKQLAEYLSTKI